MTTMIGELLIRQNVITRDDLKRAIEYQKRTGGRIGEALVALAGRSYAGADAVVLSRAARDPAQRR